MPEEFLTLKDVAELLKLSEKTVYRMAKARDLPGFKAGGQWRFHRADIDRWAEEQKRAAGFDEEPSDGV